MSNENESKLGQERNTGEDYDERLLEECEFLNGVKEPDENDYDDDYDHSVGDDEGKFDLEDSNESEENSEATEDSNESEEPAESEESEESEEDDEEDDNDKLPIWFWLTGAVVVVLAVFGIGRFIYQNFESSKILGSVPISATDVTKYVVQEETETETETESETETETEIETPEYEITPKIEVEVYFSIIARRGIGLAETKNEIAEASTTASNPKPSTKKPTETTIVQQPQQPQQPLPKPLPQQPPKNETPPQPSTEPPKEDPPKEEPPKEEPKKKDVIVKAINKSSVYGDADVELDYSVTGVKKSEIAPYIHIERDKGSNVGTYKIKITCNSNKWNVTTEDGTYTITKRYLTANADDKVSKVGETLQPLTCTVTSGSIASGDTIETVISITSGADSSQSGEYPIEISCTNPNYEFSGNGATYRVRPAPSAPKDDEEEVGPGSGDNPPGPSDPKEEVEPDKPTPSAPKDAEEGNSSDDNSSGPSDSNEEVNPYNPTPSAPKDIEEEPELVTTNKFTN